jgi:hypothetical protein
VRLNSSRHAKLGAGRSIRFRWFQSHGEALDAAGLSELA